MQLLLLICIIYTIFCVQLRRESDNAEANTLYAGIEPLKRKVVLVKDAAEVGDFQYAIPLLQEIVDVSLGFLFSLKEKTH